MGKTLYNLTNPQKSIWDTENFYPNTSINNITATAIIQDRINFALFCDAINIFVEKHDSFRLKVILQDGEPKQLVESFSPISFNIASVHSDKDVENLANKMANYVFDISNSMLCKFQLFKFPDGHGGIVLLVHHLIADAWSCGHFISEIIDIYDSLLDNKNIEIESFSYTDYIASENEYIDSPKFEKDKAFWMETFLNVPELATIPSINGKDDFSTKAKRKTFKLPKETIDVISNFCKANKISLYNFFMAIYSIYLSRVNNLDDFVIGTPVLNRSNAKEKHTVGMFISVVPFKIHLNQNEDFISFTKKISSDFFDVFRHQKYPYQTLLQDLRRVHSNIPNLYKIMISYQNMRTNKQSTKTTYDAKWYFCNHIADDIDIHFFDINDTGTIDLAYDYRTSKYSIDDIYALHSRILYMINQVLINPDALIQNIDIVTPDEKNDIVNKFNSTDVDYPKEKSIIQIFNEQVMKNPDGIAVVFGNQKLTYRELDNRANQLGNYLTQIGVSNGTIVPILLNRSIDLIVSMLAVIKVGGVYLPLSTEYPIDRLNYIINDSKSKYLIIDSSTNLFLRDDLINIDINNFQFEKYSNSLNMDISSNNLLYIIYTSGSTGNPKGVKVTHRNLNNFINSFNNLYGNISCSDRILASTNICFDVSIFEFYISLLNGCALYLYDENTITDIFKYCDSIINNKITMLYIPPNILGDVYKILKEKDYHGLSKILVGVEPIQSQVILKYYELNPIVKIINGYGPTETTICASAVVLNEDILNNYKIIPIGRPLQNTKLFVLDKSLKYAPIGVPGELHILGDNVSLGYLNNPDLTNKAFITIPDISNKTLYKTGDVVYWDNFR